MITGDRPTWTDSGLHPSRLESPSPNVMLRQLLSCSLLASRSWGGSTQNPLPYFNQTNRVARYRLVGMNNRMRSWLDVHVWNSEESNPVSIRVPTIRWKQRKSMNTYESIHPSLPHPAPECGQPVGFAALMRRLTAAQTKEKIRWSANHHGRICQPRHPLTSRPGQAELQRRQQHPTRLSLPMLVKLRWFSRYHPRVVNNSDY